MSRTANDYKLSGGFLPDFDMANPAPETPPVNPPEDETKWSAEDDTQLRRIVEMYRHYPMDQMPWQTIALKCAFGHNSGSCKARFESLPKLKYADCSVFDFTPGGGVAAYKKRGIK